MKYCLNVAQSAKKCVRVLKMQNSAPNSKKCSKGAQRNRERPRRKIKVAGLLGQRSLEKIQNEWTKILTGLT